MTHLLMKKEQPLRRNSRRQLSQQVSTSKEKTNRLAPLAVVLLPIVAVVGLALVGLSGAIAHAQSPDTTLGGWQVLFPPYPSANERLGVGLAGKVDGLTDYDVAQLHAGWYLNWGTHQTPPHPEGMVYVQVVRLDGPFRTCLRACDGYQPMCTGIIDYLNCRDDYPANPAGVGVSPDRDTIRQIAQARPGSIWLIGNEPDRIIHMDDVCPDEYAMVYHELYDLIKEADPTAKVTIGGIVQATPIRLQYLDIVMCVYEHTYGSKLPADLWNVHAFILNEEAGGWGCDLPPGMVSVDRAQRRELWEGDDMEIFKQQIHDFRLWMAGHGERDKPLVVSEYGLLMPAWMCDGDPNHNDPTGQCAPGNGRPFNYARVTAFMQATFDYFLGVDPDGVDSTVGYPADGDRLVQAWNWYSLNDDWMYNGNLFHSGSKQITELGADFGDYAAPLEVGYRDLVPWGLSLEHTPDLFAGDPVTVTISSRVSNMGNRSADNVMVRYWDGAPGTGSQLGGDEVLLAVPGRYEGDFTTAVTWTGAASDTHDFYVQVDPNDTIKEADEGNNIISIRLDFKSDLTINELTFDPPAPLMEAEQPVTITLRAEVQNVGHLAAVDVDVGFWDGNPDEGGTLIGSQTVAPDSANPLGRNEQVTAQVTWTTAVPGLHEIYARVDPDNEIAEIDEDNNQSMQTILVFTDRVFLPAIQKEAGDVTGARSGGGSRDLARMGLPWPTPTPSPVH